MKIKPRLRPMARLKLRFLFMATFEDHLLFRKVLPARYLEENKMPPVLPSRPNFPSGRSQRESLTLTSSPRPNTLSLDKVDQAPSFPFEESTQVLFKNRKDLVNAKLAHAPHMRGEDDVLHLPEGMILRQRLLPKGV